MADKKTEVERDQVADKKRKQKPPGEHVSVQTQSRNSKRAKRDHFEATLQDQSLKVSSRKEKLSKLKTD